MTHLVLGASGFLGRQLLRHLHDARPKEKVLAVDRARCELSDEAQVRQLIAGTKPDRVYHLAGTSRVSDAIGMPQYFESNSLTTIFLARALAALEKPVAVFFASTVHVYGNQAGEVSEETAPRPESDYAFSKYLAEEAFRRYGGDRHAIVIGRLFSCIGPGQAEGFVASDLARRVTQLPADGTGVLRTGPLSASRRFLDVRDAAEIFARLLDATAGKPGVEVVNVASPHEIAIRDVVDRLLKISGKKARIESSGMGGGNAFRGLRLNASKLEKLVPSAAFRPFDETLRDMLASYGA